MCLILRLVPLLGYILMAWPERERWIPLKLPNSMFIDYIRRFQIIQPRNYVSTFAVATRFLLSSPPACLPAQERPVSAVVIDDEGRPRCFACQLDRNTYIPRWVAIPEPDLTDLLGRVRNPAAEMSQQRRLRRTTLVLV